MTAITTISELPSIVPNRAPAVTETAVLGITVDISTMLIETNAIGDQGPAELSHASRWDVSTLSQIQAAAQPKRSPGTISRNPFELMAGASAVADVVAEETFISCVEGVKRNIIPSPERIVCCSAQWSMPMWYQNPSCDPIRSEPRQSDASPAKSPPAKSPPAKSPAAGSSGVGSWLPWAWCNLRRNPFGELTRQERVELAVVDVDSIAARIDGPHCAVQLIGDCGAERRRGCWCWNKPGRRPATFICLRTSRVRRSPRANRC